MAELLRSDHVSGEGGGPNSDPKILNALEISTRQLLPAPIAGMIVAPKSMMKKMSYAPVIGAVTVRTSVIEGML